MSVTAERKRAGAVPGRRRVAMVVSSLETPGGAERVAVTMANDWAARGRQVTIVTQDPPGASSFYPLDAHVGLVQLGSRADSPNRLRAVVRNARRIRLLRRALVASHAASVISFMDRTNVLSLLATWGFDGPVIVTEHNDPRRYRLPLIWRLLRWLTYRWSSIVVVLSDEYRSGLPRSAARPTVVIPNPVPRPEAAAERPIARGGEAHGTIVGMGRLDPQKAFDVLILAFGAIAPEHPGWNLAIYGEGALRPELEQLVAAGGLDGRVSLPGLTRDPENVLRSADIFVLSSRFEGFPMVLCEAMAVGSAVITTDAVSGIRDIVRPGIDALTVPPNDAVALATALDALIRDPDLRLRLGRHGPEILDRYGTPVVMATWDRLLESLMVEGDRRK